MFSLLLGVGNTSSAQICTVPSENQRCCFENAFDFTYSQQLTGVNQAQVDFTLTSDGLAVGLIPLKCGVIVGVKWNFDNNTTTVDATTLVAQNTYSLGAGCATVTKTVKICITVEDSEGTLSVCMVEKDIVINNSNVASTHTIVPVINSCGAVNFSYTGATINNPIWTFGDGAFDNSGQNSAVAHTYLANASYTVTLNGSNIGTCLVATTVNIQNIPSVDFSYTPVDLCNASAGVTLTINNYDNTASYLWNINNNASIVAVTGATMVLTGGLISGQNQIELMLTGSGASSCGATVTKFVNLGAVNPSFSVSNTEICVGDNLSVLGVSSGGSTYNWQVYQGGSITGGVLTGGTAPVITGLMNAGMFPSHVFTSAGTYQVKLTVINSYPDPNNPNNTIDCANSYAVQIKVNEPVDAGFTIATGANCGEVIFTLDNPPSVATSFTINYGDGTLVAGTDETGLAAPLTHTYTGNGIFNISININNETCTDTETHSIAVNDQAMVNIVSTATMLCPGNSAILTAVTSNITSGVGSISYQWFNTTSASPTAVVGTGTQLTVTTAGTYKVVASSAGGTVCFSTPGSEAVLVVGVLAEPTASKGTLTATTCGNSNGSVVLTVLQDLLDDGYTINGGPVLGTLTTTVSNLPAGPNYITIANAQDPTCTGTILVNIPDNQPTITVSKTDATCSALGSMIVSGTTGTINVYAVNNYPAGPIEASLAQLVAGAYVVEVLEGGCVVIRNVP